VCGRLERLQCELRLLFVQLAGVLQRDAFGDALAVEAADVVLGG
jgi:hypothetical protein